MVDTVYPVNAVAGAPAYSGRMLRQVNSVRMAGATVARPLGARSGVRPGTSPTTVTATSTDWSCGPFAGSIDAQAAAEAGPYDFAFDALTTGPLTAANASNPRVDIVYAQIDDPSESDGTSAPAVRRGYLAGTAAATPSAPAAPARSFAVAEINVPKAGGGSPTVTWVAPVAVAAGGILPVRTLALLNAITGYLGQWAEVTADTANNGLYKWSGSGWVTVYSDSGWVNITINSGFAASGSFTPRVRRIGKQVHLRGLFANTGMTANGGPYAVGVIPAGFVSPDFYPFRPGTQTAAMQASADTSGSGVINIRTGATLSPWFSLDVASWVLD